MDVEMFGASHVHGAASPDEAPVPQPRVTFTEFASADDPLLLGWARFRMVLIGDLARAHTALRGERPAASRPPTDATVGGRSGLWRLLATNNREMGRSFLLYDDLARARRHIEQIQAQPAALAVTIMSGPGRSSRGWVITSGGAPVMTCSRWYESSSTGVAAAQRALIGLRDAAVVTGREDPDGRAGRAPRGGA